MNKTIILLILVSLITIMVISLFWMFGMFEKKEIPKKPSQEITFQKTNQTLFDEKMIGLKKIPLEPGRYLSKVSTNSLVLIYKEGREEFAKIRTNNSEKKIFDVNCGEEGDYIVSSKGESHIQITKIIKFEC